MNQTQIQLIKAEANNPANLDTGIDVIAQNLLNRPEFEGQTHAAVEDAIFRSVIGA